MGKIDPSIHEIAPCKDCADRHEACWGGCDRYKEWKKRLDDLNKARKEYDRTRYNRYPR